MTAKTRNILIAVGIIAFTLGVALAAWALLGDTGNPKDSAGQKHPVKRTTLQKDGQILEEYKDYHFLVQEEWVRDAGYNLTKRLFPAEDPPGIIRFKPPTEYFEVGLSGDDDRGITDLNIVAASIKQSGEQEELSPEQIDELFEKGEVEDSFNRVRVLADGRSKAELASKGCLISASSFEPEKLRKFVDILFYNCKSVLEKTGGTND